MFSRLRYPPSVVGITKNLLACRSSTTREVAFGLEAFSSRIGIAVRFSSSSPMPAREAAPFQGLQSSVHVVEPLVADQSDLPVVEPSDAAMSRFEESLPLAKKRYFEQWTDLDDRGRELAHHLSSGDHVRALSCVRKLVHKRDKDTHVGTWELCLEYAAMRMDRGLLRDLRAAVDPTSRVSDHQKQHQQGGEVGNAEISAQCPPVLPPSLLRSLIRAHARIANNSNSTPSVGNDKNSNNNTTSEDVANKKWVARYSSMLVQRMKDDSTIEMCAADCAALFAAAQSPADILSALDLAESHGLSPLPPAAHCALATALVMRGDKDVTQWACELVRRMAANGEFYSAALQTAVMMQQPAVEECVRTFHAICDGSMCLAAHRGPNWAPPTSALNALLGRLLEVGGEDSLRTAKHYFEHSLSATSIRPLDHDIPIPEFESNVGNTDYFSLSAAFKSTLSATSATALFSRAARGPIDATQIRNAMLAACNDKTTRGKLEFFSLPRPDTITLSYGMTIYAELGDLESATRLVHTWREMAGAGGGEGRLPSRAVQEYVGLVTRSMDPTQPLGALLDRMERECGVTIDHRIGRVMIEDYLRHGSLAAAVYVLDAMRSKGVRPQPRSFIDTIRAIASKTNYLHDVVRLLRAFRQDWPSPAGPGHSGGFEAPLETLGPLIDLLIRNSELGELAALRECVGRRDGSLRLSSFDRMVERSLCHRANFLRELDAELGPGQAKSFMLQAVATYGPHFLSKDSLWFLVKTVAEGTPRDDVAASIACEFVRTHSDLISEPLVALCVSMRNFELSSLVVRLAQDAGILNLHSTTFMTHVTTCDHAKRPAAIAHVIPYMAQCNALDPALCERIFETVVVPSADVSGGQHQATVGALFTVFQHMWKADAPRTHRTYSVLMGWCHRSGDYKRALEAFVFLARDSRLQMDGDADLRATLFLLFDAAKQRAESDPWAQKFVNSFTQAIKSRKLSVLGQA